MACPGKYRGARPSIGMFCACPTVAVVSARVGY